MIMVLPRFAISTWWNKCWKFVNFNLISNSPIGLIHSAVKLGSLTSGILADLHVCSKIWLLLGLPDMYDIRTCGFRNVSCHYRLVWYAARAHPAATCWLRVSFAPNPPPTRFTETFTLSENMYACMHTQYDFHCKGITYTPVVLYSQHRSNSKLTSINPLSRTIQCITIILRNANTSL